MDVDRVDGGAARAGHSLEEVACGEATQATHLKHAPDTIDACQRKEQQCLVVLQGSCHGLFAALEPNVTQAVEELLLRVVRASIFRQCPLASALRSLWVALHAQRGHGREHHLPHL
eukprot:scaffold82068_cov75-Phaeocystis_antarctica.AAC.2